MKRKLRVFIGLGFVVLVSGYFILGAIVQDAFEETVFETLDVAEQDIRFAASAAPMVCVIDKYKSTLDIGSYEDIERSLDVVLTRAIPETKSIVSQIQPYDSMTNKLYSKAKYLVSDSQSTFQTIQERFTELNRSKGILETLLSITISASMFEQIQADVQGIQQQVEDLEILGEEYKKAALAKLSQEDPGSEMALAIAGHYIDADDKEAVSAELIEKITAIAQSNSMYRRYDREGCFDEYKPQIFKKVRETIHAAL